MSLCDQCFAPGACCRRLHLRRTNDDALTLWDDEPTGEQLERHGLPTFVASELIGSWKDEASGRPYSEWMFSCSALLPSGRCGIYEQRPDLCRNFEPASDSLCVHFGGAEAGAE